MSSLFSSFSHRLCAFAANALSSSDGFWRLAKRATVVAPATVYTMVMMLAWGYLYYNVVLIHIVGACARCVLACASDCASR